MNVHSIVRGKTKCRQKALPRNHVMSAVQWLVSSRSDLLFFKDFELISRINYQ